MFNVSCGLKRGSYPMHPFYVQLEGCPDSGIAAVDWRRAHGIPEAPSDEILVPGLEWTDESFCRAHAGQCNGDADIVLEFKRIYGWGFNAAGEVYQESSGRGLTTSVEGLRRGGLAPFSAEPSVVAAYLAGPTPETGRALLESIFDYPARSKAAAEVEAAAFHYRVKQAEAAKVAARELLADELRELRFQVESLAKRAEYWKAEAERHQAEEVEQE